MGGRRTGRYDEGVRMTVKDQISFLARLIRDDTGMNEENAKTWAKSHIDFVKAIKEGGASVKTKVDQPSPKYWTNNTFFTMRPTIIFGPQGQGKSFFCSWITLRALDVKVPLELSEYSPGS